MWKIREGYRVRSWGSKNLLMSRYSFIDRKKRSQLINSCSAIFGGNEASFVA
jgi:hypothetical protein